MMVIVCSSGFHTTAPRFPKFTGMLMMKQFALLCFIALQHLEANPGEEATGNLTLEILGLPMPPRIYAQAPSQMLVTQFRVMDPSYGRGGRSNLELGSNSSSSSTPMDELSTEARVLNSTTGLNMQNYSGCLPRFQLFQNNWTDYDQFSIDPCSGALSTAKYVDRGVGHIYKLVVLAMNRENQSVATKEVKIQVSTYNSKPPRLSRRQYVREVLDTREPDTVVLTVSATDNDNLPYNQELYFSLQRPGMIKNPWLYPVASPLEINVTTGEIKVTSSLMDEESPLNFLVKVADGGSPRRQDLAQLAIHIRNMSAPRNVQILNKTETSLRVCWSPPLNGTPLGYIVSYTAKEVVADSNATRGKLNLTLDELETRESDLASLNLPPDLPLDNSMTAEVTNVQQEIYNFFAHQYCTLVSGLLPLMKYQISVRGWTTRERVSMARMPLTVFTLKRDCREVDCGNGVCQETEASPGYKCFCSSGFMGDHCDVTDPCFMDGVSVCHHGGTCRRFVQNGQVSNVQCSCSAQYIGHRCEHVNPCRQSTNPCLNGGTCQIGREASFRCLCPELYEGLRCEYPLSTTRESIARCEGEVTNDHRGTFNWPSTVVGDSVTIQCPFGLLTASLREDEGDTQLQVLSSRPPGTSYSNYDVVNNSAAFQPRSRSTRSIMTYVEAEVDTGDLLRRTTRSASSLGGATRSCVLGSDGTTAYWLPPDLAVCLTPEAADEEVSEVEELFSSGNNVNSTIIASSLKKITRFVDRAIVNRTIAEILVTTISRILDLDESLIEETSEASPNATESILAALSDFTSRVPLEVGEEVNFRRKNLVIEAKLLHKDNIPDEVSFVPFPSEERNGPSERFRRSVTTKQSPPAFNPEKLWIKLPKTSLLAAGDSSDRMRFQFISFMDDRIFRGKGKTPRVDHPVLSASVAQMHMENVLSPITYMVPLGGVDPYVHVPTCVYWDTEEHSWSSKGIETKQNLNGEIFCESSHMTSFSVLLDPFGAPISGNVKESLSWITYVAISLSTIALLLTIVTFLLFRNLCRDRAGMIVLNLSFALLFLNLTFLTIGHVTSEQKFCWTFGALLHYAALASFSWMLIEAMNMYQLLVTVFPSSEIHFMRKRLFFGWVFPIIFVVAALIADAHVYYTEYQSVCVISPHSAPAVYYTTYLAPVCVVLFFNVVVFFRVTKVLCQGRPNFNSSSSLSLAHVRGAIAIIALLGITWLTGLLTVGRLRVVFQIFFCLTTPLQGFIIFWGRVFQSAEARLAWKNFLQTGSTQRRPMPHSSLRTHSSHHSSSANTQSTGVTPPHNSSNTRTTFIGRIFKSGMAGTGANSKCVKQSNDSQKKSPPLEMCKTQQSTKDTPYHRLSVDENPSSSPASFFSNGNVPTTKTLVLGSDGVKKDESHFGSDSSPPSKLKGLSSNVLLHSSRSVKSKNFIHEGEVDPESDGGVSAEYKERQVICVNGLSSEKGEEAFLHLLSFTKTPKGEKYSVSTSNLHHEKALYTKLSKSLGSRLFPEFAIFEERVRNLQQDKDNPQEETLPQEFRTHVRRRSSSCQDFHSGTESEPEEVTTKSLPDTEIDSTFDSTSSWTDLRHPEQDLLDAESNSSGNLSALQHFRIRPHQGKHKNVEDELKGSSPTQPGVKERDRLELLARTSVVPLEERPLVVPNGRPLTNGSESRAAVKRLNLRESLLAK